MAQTRNDPKKKKVQRLNSIWKALTLIRINVDFSGETPEFVNQAENFWKVLSNLPEFFGVLESIEDLD